MNVSPAPEIVPQPTARTVLRDIVAVGSAADELECSCYESAPCDACQLQAALHTGYHFMVAPQADSERLRDAAPALRDALAWAVEQTDSFKDEGERVRLSSDWREWADRARAALQAADPPDTTGGQE